jgi:hypothetical protein
MMLVDVRVGGGGAGGGTGVEFAEFLDCVPAGACCPAGTTPWCTGECPLLLMPSHSNWTRTRDAALTGPLQPSRTALSTLQRRGAPRPSPGPPPPLLHTQCHTVSHSKFRVRRGFVRRERELTSHPLSPLIDVCVCVLRCSASRFGFHDGSPWTPLRQMGAMWIQVREWTCPFVVLAPT